MSTKTKNVVAYFLSSIVVVIPFWILGSLTHIEGLPFGMQLNVLAVLALPMVSLYFVARTYGVSSIKQVLRDCIPNRRARHTGLAGAFLTMPIAAAIVVLITLCFVQFDGWGVPLYLLPAYFVVYYIGAAFEEIGWTWFATPILHEKLPAFGTGLVIGTVWTAIHTWPWYQQSGLWFMVGMILVTMVSRLFMTWLYIANGRLLWLNIAFHAMINTTFSLYHMGSPFANPVSLAPALALVCFATVVIARRLRAR